MSLKFDSAKFTSLLETTGEVGFVRFINYPIIRAEGLPSIKPESLVIFENGSAGLVISISHDYVDILVLDTVSVNIGTKVVSTGHGLNLDVSEELLGSLITPYGDKLLQLSDMSSDKSAVSTSSPVESSNASRSIYGTVLPVSKRSVIKDRFYTGVSVVDLMLPLGKGQRQLVLGDKKTGKTEFLLQMIQEQANNNVICVYACIGKRMDDINRLLSFVKERSLKNIIILSASSSDTLGDIFITPYSAMTIAEHFRDLGKDVVVIMDDLTTHAKFYRELSLLIGRFPGRSSYPGDIFYVHSRLLERAGSFNLDGTISSITCFPVVDSPAGDITGYIQTNLMSITDGHLFFDNELFEKGRRPAINYFLSVTRVGRQTQDSLMWSVNRELTSFLSLLDRTEEFVHFGAEINEGIKATLKMGERILDFLNQRLGTTRILNTQLVIFCLIWSGIFSESTHGSIVDLLEKFDVIYKTDDTFKSLLDGYVSDSVDLNALLSKVTSNSGKILKYVE